MKIIFDHLHGHVIDDRVFCEAFVIPEGESEDYLLENGWLPANQPPIYWYQSQSIRINFDKVILNKKQQKTFSSVECEFFEYENQPEVDEFFFDFFNNKNLEIHNFYKKNSQFSNLKVMSVKLDGKILGYTRYILFENSILGLESSYLPNYPKHSLGKNSILLLSDYGKKLGINYLYIYEGYKDLFSHKLEITGSELWEGEKWVDTSIYSYD
jgi:hypothetical protein